MEFYYLGFPQYLYQKKMDSREFFYVSFFLPWQILICIYH